MTGDVLGQDIESNSSFIVDLSDAPLASLPNCANHVLAFAQRRLLNDLARPDDVIIASWGSNLPATPDDWPE